LNRPIPAQKKPATPSVRACGPSSNKRRILKNNPDSGLPGPKKIKRPNLAISSFKKGQILINEKRPNFLQKFVKITSFKVRISENIASFDQISPQ